MAQLSKIDHKSKMENFISPLRFQKSNYVIRLFSNYFFTHVTYVTELRSRLIAGESDVMKVNQAWQEGVIHFH